MDIYYIDRSTGEKKKEIIAGEKYLRWNNETKSGILVLESVIKRKIFSNIYGKLQDCSFSKRKIPTFVEKMEINMDEAEIEDISHFHNFNEFFTRKLKKDARPINFDRDALISPADGKILAYENIDIHKLVQIKGLNYSLKELINDDKLANEYDKGICLVIRLSPSDYHRFHFPDNGVPKQSKSVDGHYYSVNPIALNHIEKLFCQNKRHITILDSDNFGKIILVEIGATCVGSIVQTYKPNLRITKGAEKGYFKFGGSTIMMFIKRNHVIIDKDIISNTINKLETKVLMGETIGIRIKESK